MYRSYIFSLIITFMTLTAPSLVNTADNKIITLDIPGMTCKFCPVTIHKALIKVLGVIEAKSDYETKSATVTFASEKTNVETIRKATANAGYPSTLKL